MVENNSKNRRFFLAGLIGFFIGIFVCLVWQLVFAFFPLKDHFGFNVTSSNSSMKPSFENDEDPVLQMNRLRQQMMQQALRNMPKFEPDQDEDAEIQNSMNEIETGVGSVKHREDNKFVYLDISITGLDRQSLSVEVKDGQINLRGQIHKKNEFNGGEGEIIESFNRSLPAPAHADPKKVEIENTQDTLTLKFPKI